MGEILSLKSIAAAIVLTILFAMEGIFPVFKHRCKRLQHGLRNIFVGVGNHFILFVIFAGALTTVASSGY